MKNERGTVFPLTLLFLLIALLIAAQAVSIFVSQYGFVTEVRDYYKREGERVLGERKVRQQMADSMDEGAESALKKEEMGHTVRKKQ
jgi:hypothetical protein